MSPLSLRRYRAERLLRREFQGLSARVLAMVQSRLSARGVKLGEADLEECYAQAWQGLYTAMIEGEEIDNPVAWLVTVTSRRAIDEHRRRERWRRDELADPRRGGEWADGVDQAHHDLADAIDDRVRLRHVFEAFAGELTVEESEAATLCYLQGMSRSEAATQMGIGVARMERLMEGRGRERPGVAAKVGRLCSAIGAELWCEEQASLMRALAFGILAPDGPRYELAVAHRRECPACRAYVISLRGLAVALPPVITPLHAGLLAAVAGGSTAAASGGAISAATGSGGAQTGTVVLTASASSSAAGGGWLLAGSSLAAKVAVGCALAVGLGVGCVALGVPSGGGARRGSDSVRDHGVRRTGYTASSGDVTGIAPDIDQATSGEREQTRLAGTGGRKTSTGPDGLDTAISALVAGAAAREFGLEAVPSGTASADQAGSTTSPTSSTTRSPRTPAKLAARRSSSSRSTTSTGAGSASATSASVGSASAASAEFSPSTSTAMSTSPDASTANATGDTEAATGAPSATRPAASDAAEREFGLG